MPEYSKTALTVDCLREALLYFQYVIPLHVSFFDHDEANRELRDWDRQVIALFPPELRNKRFIGQHGLLKEHIDLIRSSPKDKPIDELLVMLKILATLLVQVNPQLKTCPLITDDCLHGNEASDLSITIPSLNLIDVRKTSLVQLLEFRKDEEAMDKLRRFRLFAYDNYADKSRDYIEDDIKTRLTDYEQATQKWGFNTAAGAINILLNSSLIAGGIAGSFLTAYFKAPMEAILSALSATGIAVANMAVTLGQQRFAQKELMATNPVSYISYAKEKLESK